MKDNYLSLDHSKCVLGLCAIFIVLHHCSQSLGEHAGILANLENAGVCFVGLFFLFSGYGLIHSLLVKENYLHKFFSKRYIAILIPFFITNIIFTIYFVLSPKSLPEFLPMSSTLIIQFVTGWILANTHMWYIVEIAFFYLAFFIIFRLCKNRTVGILLMTIFVAAFTVFSLYMGHGPLWCQGEWWYNTSLLFVVGMILGNWEKPITSFMNRFFVPLLIISFAATALLWKATTYMLETRSYWSEFVYGEGSKESIIDKFCCLGVQLPLTFFFTLIVLLIMSKISFRNGVFRFLGKISLEIYIIHNLFLTIFTCNLPLDKKPVLFIVAVMACSIVAATLLHYIDSFVIGLFKRSKNTVSTSSVAEN